MQDGLHGAGASGWVLVEVVAHLHESHDEETGHTTVRVDFRWLERFVHHLGDGSLAGVSLAIVNFDVGFHAQEFVDVLTNNLS